MGVLSWGSVQVQTKGTATLNGVGPDFFLSLVVSVQPSGLGLGSEAASRGGGWNCRRRAANQCSGLNRQSGKNRKRRGTEEGKFSSHETAHGNSNVSKNKGTEGGRDSRDPGESARYWDQQAGPAALVSGGEGAGRQTPHSKCRLPKPGMDVSGC